MLAKPGRTALSTALVVALGIILSIASCFTLLRAQRELARQSFEAAASDRTSSIQREIEERVSLLLALRGLYDASDDVTGDEFHSFVAATRSDRRPDLHLLWIPLAPNPTLTFSEPPLHDIDRDLFALPQLARTLATARDQDRAVVLNPQEAGNAANPSEVVFFLPVYRHGLAPASLEARRHALRGYLAAISSLPGIVESATGNLGPAGVDIHIRQGTRLLSSHFSRLRRSPPTPGMRPALQSATIVSAGLSEWQIECHTSPEFFTPFSSYTPYAFLAIGLLVTFLMAARVRTATRQRDVIHAEVEERTRELAVARDKAMQASQIKSQILANVSHELRTPINGITGMLGFLLESPLNDEQADYARTAQQSTYALLDLVNDLLDMAQIEAGKLKLNREEISVQELVEQSVDIVASRAASKGLELTTHIDAAVPAVIYGDSSRLRQVLLNLLTNAIKFTESGGVHASVTAKPLHDSKITLSVAVEDTGIGIPADQQHRLFQRFSQVNATSTRRQGGAGLGLAISRQLVELMGGHIGVYSNPGRGSCFWFHFPAHSPATLAASPTQCGVLKGCTVAVISPRASVRKTIHAYLDQWGAVADCYEHAPDPLPQATVFIVDGPPGSAPAPLNTLFLVASGASHTAYTSHLCLSKPLKKDRLLQALRTLAYAATQPPKPLSILVADDNPINRKVAVRMLTGLGYTVRVATNGREAVDSHIADPCDVILMDCQMPEMDGYEATEAIRGLNGALSGTPVIAVTADVRSENVDLCLARGMNGYLAKPLQTEALRAVLKACLDPQPSP